VSALGEVVAGFENEPANLNAMADAFPKASMVFVDTVHSRKPGIPKAGVPWIGSYLRAQVNSSRIGTTGTAR
jgi:hypothetical protein